MIILYITMMIKSFLHGFFLKTKLHQTHPVSIFKKLEEGA